MRGPLRRASFYSAIGTYRHAVATTIPEMTKVAWGKKRDAIQKVVPGAKK